MVLMEGEHSVVRSLSLGGLTLDDGRAIFRKKGEFTASVAEWSHLIHHYGGNPLALKMVAAATQELFNGSITEVLAYIDRGTFVFEDICDFAGASIRQVIGSRTENIVLVCHLPRASSDRRN